MGKVDGWGVLSRTEALFFEVLAPAHYASYKVRKASLMKSMTGKEWQEHVRQVGEAGLERYVAEQLELIQPGLTIEPDPVVRLLMPATNNWTVVVVVRTYESNQNGEAWFAREAQILADHGYRPSTQSAEGSHLHAGRLILTGGLSVLAGSGGIRNKGKLTVTFEKVPVPVPPIQTAPPKVDLPDQIRKLSELRDAGILTQDEFDAKKAELLSRI